ncbi:hypothetical protein K438DRAFT_2024198 [Mycena galopus ATCC 62051]|nr:hypothetical protein K438DRAFT_2024198 [Mycena galopus ATCC 62051]
MQDYIHCCRVCNGPSSHPTRKTGWFNPRGAKRTVLMKVLVVGYPRTGTASMRDALEILGYNAVHHMQSIFANPLQNEMWAEAINAKFFGRRKPYGKEEWDQLLGHCQAVTDSPGMMFTEELLAGNREKLRAIMDTQKSGSEMLGIGRRPLKQQAASTPSTDVSPPRTRSSMQLAARASSLEEGEGGAGDVEEDVRALSASRLPSPASSTAMPAPPQRSISCALEDSTTLPSASASPAPAKISDTAHGASENSTTLPAVSAPARLTKTPAATEKTGSEKHNVVLAQFRSEVESPAWAALVEAWRQLEQGTGFTTNDKPLPTGGHPRAVGWWIARARKNRTILPEINDDDDAREDFYEAVVSWWVALNPAWRKEGVTTAVDFEERGLAQESGGELEYLSSGLNGLTSVVVCLWWWYQITEIAEGTPAWRELVEDICWELTEKLQVLSHKRGALPATEEPSAKCARVQ